MEGCEFSSLILLLASSFAYSLLTGLDEIVVVGARMRCAEVADIAV